VRLARRELADLDAELPTSDRSSAARPGHGEDGGLESQGLGDELVGQVEQGRVEAARQLRLGGDTTQAAVVPSGGTGGDDEGGRRRGPHSGRDAQPSANPVTHPEDGAHGEGEHDARRDQERFEDRVHVVTLPPSPRCRPLGDFLARRVGP